MAPPDHGGDGPKSPKPDNINDNQHLDVIDSPNISRVYLPTLSPTPPPSQQQQAASRSPPRHDHQIPVVSVPYNAPGLDHPLLAAGNPMGSNMRPPKPITKSNRSVSRDSSNAPITTVVGPVDADDEDLSHISNPDFRMGPPKQPEFLSEDPNSDPFESEAESHIQRALDEMDPTRAGPSEAQQSILGFVPEDTKPDQFEPSTAAEEAPKMTKPTLKRAPTYTKASPRGSTAEDLFQLADNLTLLNQQHGHKGGVGSLGGGEPAESNSDQDKLLRNAATLIQRNKSDSKSSTNHSNHSAIELPSPDNSSGAKTATSPQDRWKSLKNTVAITSGTDSSKKTDDPTNSPGAGNDMGSLHEDDEHSDNDEENMNSSHGPGRHPLRSSRKQRLKSRFKYFEDWLSISKVSVYSYLKNLLLFLILPAIGVAAILFYFGGNPPCGTKRQCFEALRANEAANDGANVTGDIAIADITQQIFGYASASWWILFICCRQPVTLSLALATQAFVIDFLALRTKIAVKLVGPFITLFIVQSKGWPFIIFWWSVYNFIMLYGPGRFARHWLYWQGYIDLFNETNPAGPFTKAPEYKTALIVALVVPAVVALKRFWVGVWFGKKTYHRYADDLTTVMRKALLIGLVAGLAREKEEQGFELDDLGVDVGKYDADETNHDDESRDSRGPAATGTSQGLGLSITSRNSNLLKKASMSSVHRIRIDKLLGSWEEPEIAKKGDKKAPIAAIIQFRQSLSYLNTAFPFSLAYGPASNRPECIASAEQVYKRLTGTDRVLRFDSIASLAIRRNGEMDEDTLKALIKVLRPDRDGTLGLVNFAKSIDTVYKELRLLRASVANSTKMDASFEVLFNVVFYFILICIVLSVMGIDPVVLFASVSGFAIGFAFMIGSAASKFFEGMLFIIVRKPYDIGDRINVSSPTVDTDYTGAPGWIVKDVDLYTTTVLYASTNEVATYANSSLASCRIINAARSPRAVVIFMIKFPLDTSYKKLKVYKKAVEEFIKVRPREWRSLLALRANRVEVDLGFVEYIVVGEHRDGWQLTGDILTSKANLTSFCLELSKKMDMRYTTPKVPVDLTMISAPRENLPLQSIAERVPYSPATSAPNEDAPAGGRERTGTIDSVDWKAVSAMFEQKK